MDRLTILFFAVCVAFICFVTWYGARQQREAAERMRQRQASRAAVPAAELSRECGPGIPPDIAERVVRILAAVSEFSLSPPGAKVDPSRLRAGDTLCEDLGYQLDSLAFCELQTELEKEFGVRLRAGDYSEPPTVRDIVRLVAGTLQAAEPNGCTRGGGSPRD